MLVVRKPEQKVYEQIRLIWDKVAKPIDGLGRFEKITARIGAIQEKEDIDISRRAILIFCADNGIVEEGISQSGQEVTLAVMKNMGKEQSSVGKMARFANIDTIPVDIGVNTGEIAEGVIGRKIRKGTRNFRKEAAMTKEETLQAIATGMELVQRCKENGYQLLGIGEMGIGNTTTSSAMAAALLSCPAQEVTGRGAGLTDEKLQHKKAIIQEAIYRYELYGAEPLTILRSVGRFDIAGMLGVCIGGALYHVPIVLDGIISLTAALAAEKLVPGTKDYLIASHRGKEPAVKKLLNALQLEAVIEGELGLGEGTGAAMMMSLLDMVLCVYAKGSTFSEMKLEQYERISS